MRLSWRLDAVDATLVAKAPQKLTPGPRREIIGKKKSRPDPTMPTSAVVAMAFVIREK